MPTTIQFEPSLIDRMRKTGTSPSRTIFVRVSPHIRRVFLSKGLRMLLKGDADHEVETVAVYMHPDGILLERVQPSTPAQMIYTVTSDRNAIHCKEMAEKLPAEKRVEASSIDPKTGSAVFLFAS